MRRSWSPRRVLSNAAFGSNPNRPNWRPRTYLNGDDRVTTRDRRIVKLAMADWDHDRDAALFNFAEFQAAFTGG
jgi:hypothetical protein